jgi:hypothetical protein
VAYHAVRPSVRLVAVWTGMPDAVMSSIDMVVEVVLVSEALPTLIADKPVCPLLVMDENMVTGSVSLGGTSMGAAWLTYFRSF